MMGSKYDALFSPMKIGSMSVKNRFVMVAMGGSHVFNPDGSLSESGSNFLIERAKGGVGLLITGATMVTPNWTSSWTHDPKDCFLEARSLTDEVHQYGAKILIQYHPGTGRTLFAGSEKTMKALGLDPETFLVAPDEGQENFWEPSIRHRAMKTEEIYAYINTFIESAKLAKEAGFDGIELLSLHEGYLLDQFAIEATNHRTDEFGGSLENRLAFTTKIIRGVKEACGNDFVVTTRYSVASKMKGFHQGALPQEAYHEFGRSLEESPKVARLLEDAGCDALDTDNGSYDSWYWAHPPMYMPMGCNLPDATFIKNFVNIPVINSGRLDDPDLAVKAIENEQIDAVGLARAFLADPDYVEKLRNGKADDIRPCIACHNGCLATIFRGEKMTCAVNPAIASEKPCLLSKTEKPKKVAVIGGGIGGMEAARIAAERGHDVSLYEKSNELGGVFVAAASPDFKESDKKLITWYKKKVKEAGVDVHLNTEATVETLKESGAEAVIVATGSVPRQISVDGSRGSNVIEAIDYLRNHDLAGKKVAIIGGGLTGCEIAYDLAKAGKTPVIIEMLDSILKVPTLCDSNRNMLLDLLRYYQVETHTSARVNEILPGGVRVTGPDGSDLLIDADTVILSVGYVPYVPSADAFQDAFEELHIIGDANKVGSLMTVVKDAYDVAYFI